MAAPTDPEDTAPAVDPDGLTDRELLETAAQGVAARRAAEVAELEAAAGWAIRHGHPMLKKDPMVSPGGDGTPAVREYALPELAMARGEHTMRTRSMVADVLDLQHRLPLTWARVVAGQCDPWVARRVAAMTRKLAAVQVGLVDRAVAAAIGAHAPSTVFEITAAKIIEADPETHAMERERERHARYVTLSRADEFGFRCVIAKTTAGDAAWIDALVDRVADILTLEHGHDHTRDELRSLAFGWLARPADLLKLLLDHTHANDDTSDDETAVVAAERPVWAPQHLTRTVDRLASMSVRQLATLRGRGVVFVHLTDQTLLQQSGIARIEGQGPMLIQALTELLGHADIALRPVLDHRIRPRVDAYEHPEAVKDHAWTQCGGDIFPFSPRSSTRASVDFDHTTPYDPAGPPGQTGPHNTGPLRRRHHRWKTHGGYRCRQAGPGRHLWQTPHGLCYLVDPTGTRRLDDHDANLILTAPPGLDIYPSNPLVLADYRSASAIMR